MQTRDLGGSRRYPGEIRFLAAIAVASGRTAREAAAVSLLPTLPRSIAKIPSSSNSSPNFEQVWLSSVVSARRVVMALQSRSLYFGVFEIACTGQARRALTARRSANTSLVEIHNVYCPVGYHMSCAQRVFDYKYNVVHSGE